MEFEALLKRLSPKLKAITYKLNGRFSSIALVDVENENDGNQKSRFYAGVTVAYAF